MINVYPKSCFRKVTNEKRKREKAKTQAGSAVFRFRRFEIGDGKNKMKGDFE